MAAGPGLGSAGLEVWAAFELKDSHCFGYKGLEVSLCLGFPCLCLKCSSLLPTSNITGLSVLCISAPFTLQAAHFPL